MKDLDNELMDALMEENRKADEKLKKWWLCLLSCGLAIGFALLIFKDWIAAIGGLIISMVLVVIIMFFVASAVAPLSTERLREKEGTVMSLPIVGALLIFLFAVGITLICH